jgi:hypothetical protein
MTVNLIFDFKNGCERFLYFACSQSVERFSSKAHRFGLRPAPSRPNFPISGFPGEQLGWNHPDRDGGFCA